MFAFHETTQRRVCRVTFLTVCVLPTLLTLGGIAFCNRPWREHDWQRALGQKLHVRAELTDISHPRPGSTVLRNVRLGDLRSDRTLGVVDELRFHREGSRLLLQAEHLQIEAEQLPQFAAAISTWLATDVLVPFDFQAEQLTVTRPSLQTVQFNKLSIRSATGKQNQLCLRLTASNTAEQRLQLVLEKNQAVLRCKLETHQCGLPAWLVGLLVPAVDACGSAEFSGVIAAEWASQQVAGKLMGQFDQVDLRAWVGPAGIHQLQGVAQLQLERLDWSDHGIEIAHGTITAHHGATSYSLLLAMRGLFSCVLGASWDTPERVTRDVLIPFDQLALGFRMTSSGITLAGECAGGELMVSGQKPLLYGPQAKGPFPIAQLVQLLHRPQQGWVPDTRGAHDLADKLPLPKNNTPETSAQRK